jgi:hypothetical protein
MLIPGPLPVQIGFLPGLKCVCTVVQMCLYRDTNVFVPWYKCVCTGIQMCLYRGKMCLYQGTNVFVPATGLYQDTNVFVPGYKCVCTGVQMWLYRGTNVFVPGYKCVCTGAGVQMCLYRGTNMFVPGYKCVCTGVQMCLYRGTNEARHKVPENWVSRSKMVWQVFDLHANDDAGRYEGKTFYSSFLILGPTLGVSSSYIVEGRSNST